MRLPWLPVSRRIRQFQSLEQIRQRIDVAAQTYFDTSPDKLTLTQAGSDVALGSEPLHPGQKYDVRLEATAEELAAHRPEPKYVYLFGFDCSGDAVLLYAMVQGPLWDRATGKAEKLP